MKIAIASGKGGTGKTTIATNLALTLANAGTNVQLLDCDVEEPNCHIFLKPEIESATPVTVPIPKVIEEKCTGCGICAEVCEFSAIAVVKKKVLIFSELCHGCGACSLFCPEDAFIEVPREVGAIEKGYADGITFTQGLLNIGELMSPAVISEVKKSAGDPDVLIIDSPPGTSCPVIEAVKDAEFILLVTEPTPFGLNDLKLAVGMAKALNLPFAVAINRSDIGDDAVAEYCRRENIEIFLEIPNDRRIAEAYSRGEMVVRELPEYLETFKTCWDRIRAFSEKETSSKPDSDGTAKEA
ncbi:MAG TPA: (4Fe-4S)-binding protein [Deltaproteobacteria bacterium]|nr:(4Fe-4S)-binding protein [Deltaproteobacteria bacterium]